MSSHKPFGDMDWEDVKTFTATTQAGTVRTAAGLLGVHHSTVARRIERLEDTLGTRLFDRQPDGLTLTEAGEILRSAMQNISSDLFDLERRLAGQQMTLKGTVRITMPPIVAKKAFAPRLPDFARAHPDLSLEILTTTDRLDVARREADIAIRMDNNPPPSLIGKRLFAYVETIYATPDYLTAIQSGQDEARWICWDQGEAFLQHIRRTPWPDAPLWGAFVDPELQQEAVRAGLGLASLPCFMGDDDPLLVRAVKTAPTKARDVWLLTHADLKRTARIRTVMDFAQTVLRDNQMAFEGKKNAT